jgi:hypothetical protein
VRAALRERDKKRGVFERVVSRSPFGEIVGDLALAREGLAVFRANMAAGVPVMKSFGAALGTTAGAGGMLGTVAGGLSTAFTTVAGIISGPVLAIIAGVIITIIAFRDEIMNTIDAVLGIADPFIDFFERISAAFGEVTGGGLFDLFFGLVRFISPLGPILDAIQMNARIITIFFTEMFDAMLAGLEPAIKAFVRLREGLGVIGGQLRQVALDLGLISEEGSFLETVFAAIGFAFKVAFAPLRDIMTAVGFLATTLFAVIGGIAEGLAREFGPIFTEVQGLFSDIGQIFDEFVVAFDPLFRLFSEIGELLGFTSEEFDAFGVIVQAVAAVVRFFVKPIVLIIKLLVLTLKSLAFWGQKIVAFFLEPFRLGFQSLAKILEPFIEAAKELNAVLAEMFGGKDATLSDRLKFFFEAIGEGFSLFPGAPEIPGAHRGGFVKEEGVANLHPNEGIIPLRKFPEVAARTVQAAIPEPRTTTAQITAGGSGQAAGGGTPVSINVPVTVMLDDLVLGQVVARVSEEQIRQQFGTRSVRLAGI